MTPLAGPVFPEWYWGPILFTIVYGAGPGAYVDSLQPVDKDDIDFKRG